MRAFPKSSAPKSSALKSSAFWPALFLVASTQSALSQRCPPNSHPAAVAIPGNLRTAQCFCNAGYVPVRGVCVRPATPKPPLRDPSKALVQPQPR